MILSMTAFSRQQMECELGTLVCEIRSINHRFLETYVRLPESLLALDGAVRALLRTKIKRGKLECIIKLQPLNNTQGLELNQELIEQILQANHKIMQGWSVPNGLTTKEILHWPNVFSTTQTIDAPQLSSVVLSLVTATLEDLIAARLREGDALKTAILNRLDLMAAEIEKITTKLPEILIGQREKLLNRFKEASVNLDPERLTQEMVIQAQKIDVSEELTRLAAHINEVRASLDKPDAMGRRLDFLMQELNREANTLGAKSIDTATTFSSVELKVFIEQMREQVQNIE